MNMLRVVKVTSPMSVGSWLISAFGGASAAAAACAVTGLFCRRPGPPATAARLHRPGRLHVHRGADLQHGRARLARGAPGDAVPVRRVRRQRRGWPGHDRGARRGRRQAVRFAVLGAATELTAKSLLLRRLGEIAEPYQSGRPGRLMEIAEVLTAAGLAGAILAGRSRTANVLAGTALVASSALTRLGIFEAGLPALGPRPEVHGRPAAGTPGRRPLTPIFTKRIAPQSGSGVLVAQCPAAPPGHGDRFGQVGLAEDG